MRSADKAGRVLLIHPERLFAEAVAERLQQDGLAAQASSPSTDVEVLHVLRQFRPDLVVTALLSPEAELFPMQVLTSEGVVVLAIVPHGSTRTAIRALDAGAHAFLTTSSSLDELAVYVVRCLAGDDLHARSELAAFRQQLLLEDQQRQDRLSRLMDLSPREGEILSDLVDGITPELIARRRSIAISTVRSHVKRILTKLAVTSQLEAVAHARRAGWRKPRPSAEDDLRLDKHSA